MAEIGFTYLNGPDIAALEMGAGTRDRPAAALRLNFCPVGLRLSLKIVAPNAQSGPELSAVGEQSRPSRGWIVLSRSSQIRESTTRSPALLGNG